MRQVLSFTFLAAIILLLAASPAISAHAQRGAGKTETRSINVGGVERSYLFHRTPQQESSYALVIALHGGGGNPAQFAKDTRFNDKADQEGFIVVYPRGTGTLAVWDAIHCCGSAFDEHVDDVGFISALIDEMIRTEHIDPKRVYVTGHSNGAMMSYRLGSELSDKIAAIAVSAGTIGGKATPRSPMVQIKQPAEPISVLVFHGKIDENVLYDGGVTVKGVVKGRYDLSVAQSVGFWVKADGCTGDPQDSQFSQHVTVKDYPTCNQHTEVTLYSIDNQGHAWPGGTQGFVDPPSKDIAATDIIWDFFKAHPKAQ